jgi:phospholipase C
MASCVFLLSLLILLSSLSLISGAIPPGAIKHFVYLIQENRSFDHILGWLKRTHPEIQGLTGEEYNLFDSTDPNSQKFFVHDDNPYRTFSPGHSIGTITEQVFGTSEVIIIYLLLIFIFI